jgi:hypothetical protein
VRRAVAGLGLLLAASCSSPPVIDTSVKPYVVQGGTRLPYVCGLVSGEQVASIFDLPGVDVKDTSEPDSAYQLGACTYTAEAFELTVEAYPTQVGHAPADFVMAALNGAGRPVAGLGEAAAVGEHGEGVSRLVMVEGDVALFLTGPAGGLEEAARVALLKVDALW